MNRTIIFVLLALTIAAMGCSRKPANVKSQGQNVSDPPDAIQDAVIADQGTTQLEVDVVIPTDARVAATKNFYFVIDGSGSMDGRLRDPAERKRFGNRMGGAKFAVGEAFKLVPEDANVGLYAFDWSGQSERVALSAKKTSGFIEQVEKLSPSGGTPLVTSMQAGIDALVAQREKQLGYGEYRLIVVTDGEADYVPNAIAYANQNGIPVFGIGLEVNANHPLREGTIYSDANSIAELQTALADTLGEMTDADASELFD